MMSPIPGPAIPVMTFANCWSWVLSIAWQGIRECPRRAVLCGATSCAEMSAFGRSKEHVFKGFLNLKHSIPSHDTFSTVFRMIDPKALDAAFGQVLAKITALLGEGDVIAIDGKALRGARDKGESARTRMMVSAYAARLRLTLATLLGHSRIPCQPMSDCRQRQ
jgi:hypothetical protein